MSIERNKLILSVVEMAYNDPISAQLFFSFLSEEELKKLPELTAIIEVVNDYLSSEYSNDVSYKESIAVEVKKLKGTIPSINILL